ncbi:MAG: response regulator [Elusimicrobia bacterium]|nr:response regulator [Elusimicrobiota bacterium]
MAHILVVDDDPDLLILLEAHYGVRGHLVSVATSCEAALETASKQKPDIVLLDFCLPKMDGARFIEIMRADPLTKDVPVIVMTAASSSWVASRLPKDPKLRLIDKPFDFAQLDPLIDAALATSTGS